ncbi:putative adhesin [Actinomadura pelletieri DSM 43383]|uniref:Putative adhesin n=1 Tax=Actinomadura pelletieri DSM 43383 TaxID=1120940 RepID=A0A495QTH6_9ACTN|nr:DUF4097 family beta strand repeat-containing protein [Actinomadura pelletieri]RKS76769.1 putative adhesin [Actinomadura pelletieri DSM 43383]
MRTLTITAALTAAAAATLTGCGNLSFGTHHEDRTYSAPANVTTLKIRGGGDVQITTSDSPGIKVRERLRWSNDKNKPTLRHVTKGDTVTLSNQCARATIGVTQCGVSYRVQVPKATPVEVDTEDGSITASGLGGTVKLHSDNGALRVTDLRATSVSLSTNDGAIHASGHAKIADLYSDNGAISATGLTTDRLTARTRDGDIDFGGRATVADVSTANGSIEAGGLTSDRLTAKTDNGSVDLRLTTPPSGVRATSANGTVQVRVPTGQSYAISASSINGGEQIDSAFRQDSTSGRSIHVRSANGDVAVLPA